MISKGNKKIENYLSTNDNYVIMVRTLTKNFVHKDTLLKTLGQECTCCKDKKGLKKLGKNELCWKAHDLGKLTDIQLHESFP